MSFIMFVIILEWGLEYQFYRYVRRELNEADFLLGTLPAVVIGIDFFLSIFMKEISELFPFTLNNITLVILNLINIIKIIRLKKLKLEKGTNLMIFIRIIYFLSMSIILAQKIIQIYQSNV